MRTSRTPASASLLRPRILPRINPTSFRPMSTHPRTRPPNWKSLAPPPLPGLTFGAQPSLPTLPVPKLSDTLKALKDSLKPLAETKTEWEDTARKVDEFEREGGIGEVLQRRLEARAREPGRVHWLEEWWDDGAYLAYRDSVVVNVSYFYGFNDHPPHLPQTPVHRAASLVRGAMLFREQYKQGQLEPEKTKEGPICMDTYRWMFDCCRVPGQPADWSVSYAQEGNRGDSGHVVVLRRGRVWKLQPWVDGKLLSVEELQKQLEYIYEHTTEEYPAVGLLTASNRDVWTKDYDALAGDPHNASILQTIHSAAFVLCLDTERAPDLVAHSRLLWHGAFPSSSNPSPSELGLRNRWMDKPLQFVVTDDGKAGFVGEHSVMDGTPTVNLCDRVLDMFTSPDFFSPVSQSDVPMPVALDWNVSSSTQTAIQDAARAAYALISSQSLNIIRTPYGKRAIKNFGVSPDSWAQLLVQLAYARLLKSRGEKRNGATYEAASTRRFVKGRTEAIRVVTEEADRWVEAMMDKGVGLEERARRFKEAVAVHGRMARAAGKGLGVDRHLLGLKKTLQEDEPLPAMFADPLVSRSSYWVLSTSAVFSKHFGPYGWGEVVPDGFGVAYMTGFDDYLQYTITSRTEMPNKEFCSELERAAQDMYDLHAALAKKTEPESPKARY